MSLDSKRVNQKIISAKKKEAAAKQTFTFSALINERTIMRSMMRERESEADFYRNEDKCGQQH